jgi:GT2 family glycosyltransferase
MAPVISIIILNWNGRKFLKECLDSLLVQTFREFETILVDNGSSDGSVLFVRENYPWVRLVLLSENLGFSEGNNRGLLVCRGSFIVTLNNDTRVAPGFLAEMLGSADPERKIGMVAAKIVAYLEPGRIDGVGVKIAKNGMAYNIGVGETDRGQFDAPERVFGPCAGAALYCRAMLDQVGFFDPEFFAYQEDTDLAWRGRLAGWKCVTAPKALVYHIHSATSGKMSAFTVYHVQRNKWCVVFKNWPLGIILKHLPSIIACDAAALLLAVMTGRGIAALRARIDVLRNLRRVLDGRRKVQELKKLSNMDIEGLFSSHEPLARTFFRKLAGNRG